ncbi:hypothetical protein ACFV3R_00440 [Streptomyces sp. NPDC059740]|uniref:hypothetical protein n=1 Tax=Streptomyces sp. NPDC059740 TaxID=3346926 RepID=UPI003662D694
MTAGRARRHALGRDVVELLAPAGGGVRIRATRRGVVLLVGDRGVVRGTVESPQAVLAAVLHRLLEARQAGGRSALPRRLAVPDTVQPGLHPAARGAGHP